jgi:hypothetical protein
MILVTYFWMLYVCQKLGVPYNTANRKFLYGWWLAEGGNNGPNRNIYPSAKWNWLNSDLHWPGSTTYNTAADIQNYPSWNAGVAATVATLKLTRYADIRAAMKSGAPLTHWPVDGLSTWVTGDPHSPAGHIYAERVKALVQSL